MRRDIGEDAVTDAEQAEIYRQETHRWKEAVAKLEAENQALFDQMTRAEELNNELESTVQDLNEKYGGMR